MIKFGVVQAAPKNYVPERTQQRPDGPKWTGQNVGALLAQVMGCKRMLRGVKKAA